MSIYYIVTLMSYFLQVIFCKKSGYALIYINNFLILAIGNVSLSQQPISPGLLYLYIDFELIRKHVWMELFLFCYWLFYFWPKFLLHGYSLLLLL